MPKSIETSSVDNLSIEQSDCVIGATIHGVSMADVMQDDQIRYIERALEKYGVLIFPDQFITPHQQVAWSRCFATLEKTEVTEARLEGAEEIFVVGNTGKSLITFSPRDENEELEWHTDHIHHETPARASLLRALEVPDQGGDTLFACMYSAYDALTKEQQQAYCQLEVINHVSGLESYLQEQGHTAGAEVTTVLPDDGVLKPLVREHPLTGRRALYFGNQISIGIKGWSGHRSRVFFQDLTKHACRDAFRYRHHWHAGDAVLWDNRRVLHAGTPFDTNNSRRCLHRTTWREDTEIVLIG